MHKNCKNCGDLFYSRPSRNTEFCSVSCYKISRMNNMKSCPVCDKRMHSWKTTCSRICSNRNRIGVKYKIGQPNSNAVNGLSLKSELASLRGGVCELCRNHNYNILQVHHIVEQAKGGTDELENLQLLCPNCHMTIHSGYSEYG